MLCMAEHGAAQLSGIDAIWKGKIFGSIPDLAESNFWNMGYPIYG